MGNFTDRLAASNSRYWIYANTPPHFVGANSAGGNEAFVDGSASWFNFNTMYHFTTWASAFPPNAAYVYWHQDSMDFNSTLMALLPSLK